MAKGSCDCSAVSFEVSGLGAEVTICHCGQCRRTSGHQWASIHASFDKVVFTNEQGLTWYKSSAFAKRGFCKSCGSSLFYRMNDDDSISIAPGCLDQPTGLTIGKHIFVKDKADYYEIIDDAPQIETY
ncbi:GFA family protein [Yoonia maritima]|uniref:GFA family protein n=1 Tax=Yoonia maritima TaxID=1435347 RepID=UPI000D0FBC25|nr:GFA family protein [Yoonia maritima]